MSKVALDVIHHSLLHAVWCPIMGVTRWRHLRYRKTLETIQPKGHVGMASTAGV